MTISRVSIQHRFSRTPYAFLFLPGLFFVIFFFYPLLDAFYLSLTEYHGIGPRVYIGLSNYARLIKDPSFLVSLKNTLYYVLGVAPALVIFGFALAVLTERKVRGKIIFKALYYFPVITSLVIVAITWRILYNQNGLLNYALVNLGLISAGPAWLANSSLALPSLMLVTSWQAVGSYMVIFIAGLKGVPKELYEAAMIDGAGAWQLVRYITIPSMRRFIMLATVLAIIGTMKVFTEVFVMTGGGPGDTTMVLNLRSYFWAFKFLRLGYGAAAGVVVFIITLVFTIITISVFELRRN